MHWQELVALGIVAAAAVYLARCAWRTIAGKRAGGCGSCSSCPTINSSQQQPLVQIGFKAIDVRETYAAQDEALRKVWDDPDLDVYNDYGAHAPRS